MVKSAQVRHSRDKVRPHAVVVVGVSRKNPAQVRLTQHHHMVQALPSYAANQLLNMAILPGRAQRKRTSAGTLGGRRVNATSSARKPAGPRGASAVRSRA